MEDLGAKGGSRGGMVEGCTLSCYLRLVDWTSRLVRDGKANLDPQISSIFERLKIDSSAWEETVARLFAPTRRTGSHFGTPDRLREAAQRHHHRWHRNQFRRVPHPAHIRGLIGASTPLSYLFVRPSRRSPYSAPVAWCVRSCANLCAWRYRFTDALVAPIGQS